MERGTKTQISKKKLRIVQQMKKKQKKLFKNLKKLKNKQSDFIWLVYHQCQIFQKFEEKEQFASMVLKFSVSKMITVFKIALSKLMDNYPKIKTHRYLFTILNKHLKTIREICKENANEFKEMIKIYLKTLAFP